MSYEINSVSPNPEPTAETHSLEPTNGIVADTELDGAELDTSDVGMPPDRGVAADYIPESWRDDSWQTETSSEEIAATTAPPIGRPPREELVETAKQASWHVYHLVPSKVGAITVELPPEAAAEEVQKVIEWEINNMSPEVPLSEHLVGKLPAIRQSVAEIAGVAAEDLPSFGAAADPNRDGQHLPRFNYAYVSPRSREQVSEEEIDLINAVEERSAAHELAHGAYNKASDHVVLIKPKPGQASREIDLTNASGLDRTHFYREAGQLQARNKGAFFSESWPEEVAARYAAIEEPSTPPTDTHHTFTDVDGNEVNMDPKYVTRRGEQWIVQLPALAAQAMDRLDDCRAASIPGSRPLFDIMTDIQRVETRAAAQKEFIATLNTLEPGLYRTLRDLEHSTQGFVAGLRIAEELHRKLLRPDEADS